MDKKDNLQKMTADKIRALLPKSCIDDIVNSRVQVNFDVNCVQQDEELYHRININVLFGNYEINLSTESVSYIKKNDLVEFRKALTEKTVGKIQIRVFHNEFLTMLVDQHKLIITLDCITAMSSITIPLHDIEDKLLGFIDELLIIKTD